MRRSLAAAAVASVLVFAVPASASAPPVGPLPPGPVTTIGVRHGEYFAIALPPLQGRGQVWRIARAYNSRVVTEVSEANLRRNVVVVFRALRPGKATISYAATVGERTKALKSRVFQVTIR